MAGTVLINGMKLRQLRDQLALSQEGLEFASSQKKGCSVSIATIKRAELGTPLSRRTVSRLAKFFDIPIDVLISLDSDKSTEMNSLTVEKPECLILWLKSASKDMLNEIARQTAKLEPLFTNRLGNTLVIALPCLLREKKLYLVLQNILLELSFHPINTFNALLTIQALTHSSNNQWCLDDENINKISDMAMQLQRPSILVSDVLCDASLDYFSYQNDAPISAHKTLVKRFKALSSLTVGREHEIQLFRYTLDRVNKEQISHFLTINGVEGIGKSHMLNIFSDMAKADDWLTVNLDFAVLIKPSDLLTKQLYETLMFHTEVNTLIEEDHLSNNIVNFSKNISNLLKIEKKIFLSIDNFHLIDQSELNNILKVMESLIGKPVLFTVSYLPSNVTVRYIEEIRNLRLPEVNMALTALSTNDMKVLLEDNKKIVKEKKLSYIEKSEGNPYYLQQLVLHRDVNALPSTLDFLIQNKINGLSLLSKQIITLISLATHSLTLEKINSIIQVIDSTIEELVNARLIKLTHNKTVKICQPFLRDVILLKINHKNMCCTYILLAKQIQNSTQETSYKFDNQLLIADYYSKGEAWYEAALTFLDCALYYLEKGEFTQAQLYINLSLKNHQNIYKISSKSNELLLDIRLSLATIIRITHGWVSHSTVAAYQNCISLAKSQKCSKRHCIALSGLWVTQLMAMEFEASETTAYEVLLLAEESNELNCKALAHSCLTNSQFWLAKHSEAITNAKLSFQYSKEAENKSNYAAIGINPLALAGCFGSLSATLLCQNEDVLYFQSYNQDNAIIGDAFSYAIILQGEVWVNYHARNFEQVIKLSEQLLSLAKSNNFPFYKGIAMLFKGWAQFFISSHDKEQSLLLVEDGFNNWLASSGDQIAHSLYSLIKAELYIKVSRQDEAMRLLESGIEIALQKKEACYLAPMYRMLAPLKNDVAHYKNLAKITAEKQGAILFCQD